MRCFASVVCLLLIATADAAPRHAISGRTGLLTVREGKNQVRAEDIQVDAQVQGGQITITQTYRLRAQRASDGGPLQIEIGLREDDYQRVSVENTPRRGFARFSAALDGKPLKMEATAWSINRVGDTATRWRTAKIDFTAGQLRTLRVQTVAPLGVYGNKPLVQFISKDLGGWQGKPNRVEIRLRLPGSMESRVAGVEPKPVNINSAGIRWVYRKASMRRDIFVLLPPK